MFVFIFYSRLYIVFSCIEQLQLHTINSYKFSFIFILLQIFPNFPCYGFFSIFLLKFYVCILLCLLHGVFIAVHQLSLVAVSRATLHWGVWLSHYSGFSCHRAWVLVEQDSVAVAHRLSNFSLLALERGLSSCGTRALLPQVVWDPPGPGIKLVSPALAGGFWTTGPPVKSLHMISGACSSVKPLDLRSVAKSL